MIGMGAVKAHIILRRAEQGKGADVYTRVIIGELKPWKHSLNDPRLPAAGTAEDADEIVKGREILLGNLHTEITEARKSPGCKKDTVEVVPLHPI